MPLCRADIGHCLNDRVLRMQSVDERNGCVADAPETLFQGLRSGRIVHTGSHNQSLTGATNSVKTAKKSAGGLYFVASPAPRYRQEAPWLKLLSQDNISAFNFRTMASAALTPP